MTARKLRAKPKASPAAVAASLRRMFRAAIPTTLNELRHAQAHGHYQLSASDAARIVSQQTGCSFPEAASALREPLPELFADYWEGLIASTMSPDPSAGEAQV